MAYSVHVLHDGYSKKDENGIFKDNCTCTLIKGPNNVIIDTMTPWDKDTILTGLAKHGIKCDEINYSIATHGHSDHIGNLNLFTNVKQLIVGFCVSHRDSYECDPHPFQSGVPYKIDGDDLQVIATPGHTADDVSVIVQTPDLGTVVVAGDLFEREEDLENPSLWHFFTSNLETQQKSRNDVLLLADYIVPGHGPMFKVTADMKHNAQLSIAT